MQNTSNKINSEKINSAFKLTLILAATTLVAGCISAKSEPTAVATPAAAAVVAPATPITPAVSAPVVAEVEPVADQLTNWTVVAGSNLWSIAGIEEVYNVPERWPLIYKANLDQIIDADLIYPGQVLAIPRDATQSAIDAAINHARTRGAWAVGPIEASDIEYLKNPG
ncbi:LysM peptidoglycan-binding domain-containing protein [Candidatus Spongiihabitans sp.]|uniref:LysM peptidoglycan-binding domain-containing protein n=1 Tax=Candidatus Spongiihabitans sp. TaxID=3101308 RepID=UPI003C7986DD